MNPIGWIKNNKLATILILIVLFLGFSKNTFVRQPIGLQREMYEAKLNSVSPMAGDAMMGYAPQMGRMVTDTYEESAALTTENRRIVTETYLSLQVNDVPETITNIKEMAESLSGFMVNSNLSRPEEAANGTITIRVPTDRADEMISYLKESAIKVVNEDIQGRDITDQYRDIESRLQTLQSNKARFENLMDEAQTVEEILKIQNHIFNLQDQIDSLIGQRDYLRDTSDTVKITAYLSTDEYSLPYVPDTSWRPEVVFKEAVRSLILDIRGLGNKLIWLFVYSVIWIPAILIFIGIRRYWKTRSLKAK